MIENVHGDKYPMIELLDVVSLDIELQRKLEGVQKANEGREIGRKLKQIGALYRRLLKDAKRYPEWNDLSIEMLLPDLRGVTSRHRGRR